MKQIQINQETIILIVLISLSVGAILQAWASVNLFDDMLNNSAGGGMKIKSGDRYYVVQEWKLEDHINYTDLINITEVK